MANNRIQIKRSTTTAITNTTPSVNAGELVFTSNGYVLAIGDPANSANVIAIGGLRTPGTLTANQALVANSTSGIDKVIVANLVPTNIWANGAGGTAGQYLTSNSSGGVYWSAPSAGVAGSDTQVQFNDGGVLAGDAGLTFNKTTDTLSTNNVFATSTVNAATIQVGTSVVANSSRLVLGTAVGLQVNNSIGTAGQILYSNGTTAYWGAAPTGDITAVTAGNGLTGGGTSGDVTLDVGAGNGITVAADSISVDGANGISVDASGVNVLAGNSTVFVNASGVFVNTSALPADGVTSVGSANGIGGGTITATGTLYAVAGNSTVFVNASGIHVNTAALPADGVTSVATGNGMTGGTITTTGTVSVLANNGIVANSTGLFAAAANGISVTAAGINVLAGNTTIFANASGVFVNTSALPADGVTSVATGNGMTGGTITTTGTVSVLANTGIVANATGVYVNATYIGTLTANNANNLNGQPASYYTNATNITTGTLPWAQAPTGTVNTSGAFTFTGIQTFSANVVLSAGLSANGGFGTAGQTLHTDGTKAYWAADDQGVTSVGSANGIGGGTITTTGTLYVVAGNSTVFVNASGIHVNTAALPADGVTSVATGNGLIGGTITSTGTISVLANTGVTANSTGIFIGQPVSTTSNVTFANVVTTLLTVTGNAVLGDATADILSINARVNTSIVPSANATYDLGAATLRWNNVHSNNVLSNFGSFSGNVTIGGDLVVTGNVTTVNVSSLSVNDPLIKLAVNNTTGDTLYIGFTGHYNGFGNTTNHTGLFREPSNKNYYLFGTYGDEAKVGNNEIIITDPSFSLANLTTYLLSSGLTTNAGSVYVTANSTVNVNISANVLSLSGRANNDLLFTNSTGGVTGLALGTSGYVLQSNGSAIVYDTLDGGTF